MPETVGFEPEEIRIDESTRSARLKWVVVIDSSLERGLQANAAVCVSAATQAGVTGLLGPDATDASGGSHPGLPWAGCTVLGATSEELVTLALATGERDGVFAAIMPASAQATRVYSEYLAAVEAAPTAELKPLAVSIVGERKAVDKLIRRLQLLQ